MKRHFHEVIGLHVKLCTLAAATLINRVTAHGCLAPRVFKSGPPPLALSPLSSSSCPEVSPEHFLFLILMSTQFLESFMAPEECRYQKPAQNSRAGQE